MSSHTKRVREEHTFIVGDRPNTRHIGLTLEDGKRPILNLPDAIRAEGSRGLFMDLDHADSLIEALELAKAEMAAWDERKKA